MGATDGIDWTTAGPLAAAFVGGGFAFVKGWIVPGKIYERELDRNRTQGHQLEKLQTTIQDEFLPAYRAGTDALERAIPLLDAVVRTSDPGGGG